MSSPRIRRIGDTRDQLGESPVWDDRTQRLYWIDSLTGTIHRLDPATGELRNFQTPAPIGSMVLRHDGGAMLALRHGFSRYDFERGEVVSSIAEIVCDHPMVRLNDGKVDPQGRFVADRSIAECAAREKARSGSGGYRSGDLLPPAPVP